MVVYGIESQQARKLAYPLLAWAARLHWSMDTLPELARGKRGKPYFPQFPQYQFNVSHSGTLAVCALDERPVGVDIQIVQNRREKLIERVCSTRELDWLRSRGDKAEDFALLWAMKESRCKHSGEGLRLPVSNLTVPLPEENQCFLEGEGLRFWLSQGDGWRFALCGSGIWNGQIHWVDPGILNTEEITI